MKKFLIIFLIFSLCFSFTGCVESDPSSSDQKTLTNNSQSNDKNKTFGLNEKAELDVLSFTITEIQESKGNEFFKPEDGNIFVGIKITIENISDEEQYLSSLLLFEAYVDDIKCDYSINAACVFTEGTLDGSVAAGKKLVGWYSLELPKDWSEIELTAKDDWTSYKKATFILNK